MLFRQMLNSQNPCVEKSKTIIFAWKIFCEIIWNCRWTSNERITSRNLKKFRQINYSVISLAHKTIAFTKFLWKKKCDREFLLFPHCVRQTHYGNIVNLRFLSQKFRQINFLLYFNLIWRKKNWVAMNFCGIYGNLIPLKKNFVKL